MAPQQSTEPYQPVAFDMDTVTRPASEFEANPFVARLVKRDQDGAELEVRNVVFKDPSNLPWQTQMEISNAVQFLRHCVSSSDRDFIVDLEMEGWKFNELIKRFLRHYKIDAAADRARSGGLL